LRLGLEFGPVVQGSAEVHPWISGPATFLSSADGAPPGSTPATAAFLASRTRLLSASSGARRPMRRMEEASCNRRG
jgi:hypothetical protein